MSDFDDVPPEDPYDDAATVDEGVFAEQSTLGGALISAKALQDVLGAVRPADFCVPKHDVIFTAIIAVAEAGIAVDVISVTEQLLKTGQLRQAGGADYLHSLTSIVPTAANAGYYAGVVAERGLGRAVARIGARLQQPIPVLGVEIERTIQELQDMRVAGVRDEGPHWLGDILAVPEDDDAYDWVIPGLLERGDRLMLSASEGAGKSELLRQIAVLGAAGIHPFQFHQIPPVQVLVVDAENSVKQWRRAARRVAETARTRGVRDPMRHVSVRAMPVMDISKAKDIGRIHRWMDDVRPDLVVLGPLYRMAGGSSLNSDDDVAPVLHALDTIRERGVAMLIEVHAGHARSTSGERELRPRGSSALLGWPEFGLGLRRDKVQDGRQATFSLIRWRGDRDRREWPRLVHGQVWPWEPTY